MINYSWTGVSIFISDKMIVSTPYYFGYWKYDRYVVNS